MAIASGADYHPPTRRSRRVAMDDFDLAMLSFALLDAFPGMMIFDAFEKLLTPDLRSLEVAQLFGKDDKRPRFFFFCLPQPRWSPVCLPELPAGVFHFLANPPRLIIECRCGGWYWGGSDEPKWILAYRCRAAVKSRSGTVETTRKNGHSSVTCGESSIGSPPIAFKAECRTLALWSLIANMAPMGRTSRGRMVPAGL